MSGSLNDQSTESDRSLSNALIGGAFGFIGIAIFSSASYADKVISTALWYGNLVGTFAVVALVVSIIFGGRGWTGKGGKGALHPFNLQAIFGLIGIILLGISAGIFAFHPKPDSDKIVSQTIEARLRSIEAQQASQAELLHRLTNEQHVSPSGVAPVDDSAD